MKTKVCLAVTKGIWGGAQEYVYTLATRLPKDRFDVFVICGEGGNLREKLEARGIRVIQIESMKRDISFFTEFHNLFELVRIFKTEKPDVLHLNSSKMGGLGSLAGRLAKVPKIIFTGHGWTFNEERSWFEKIFFYQLHYLTILFSHLTIAVSEKTRKDIKKIPFVHKKIVVIHNGIGQIDFLDKLEARKQIRNMARLSENGEIIIGTISELHKNKGLDLLLSACQNLPDGVSVYIIGEGEERKNLERLIKAYQLERRIFLLGRVPEARKYLKAFDIFTLTSRTEALPYTILEAGLAECAVIASRVGGIPEIITNGVSGMLIHRNIKELEKVLNDLIADPAKRLTLSTALRQTVEQNFSVEQMMEKTVEVYTKS